MKSNKTKKSFRRFFKKFLKGRHYIVCIFAILMCILILYITAITNHKKYLSSLTSLLCKNNIKSFTKAIDSDKSIDNVDFLHIYNTYIQKNYADFNSKKIDETTYINNLIKIRDLKNVPRTTLTTYLAKSDKYQKSQSDYDKGLKLMNSKDYKGAFALLSSITDLSSNYQDAKKKSLDCSHIISTETINDIKKLCSQNKFIDAEKVLNDNKKYIKSEDYNNSIKEIDKGKESYFKSLPDYNPEKVRIGSFPESASVTADNINKMNVPSETKYLIYVNTAKQLTYIFCGRKNSWMKYKEFSCSTGIPSSATPTGFFKVGMKGAWFFSPKYGEGGKFYTAFKGTNYLFHSVPYDSSGTKVLDNTLGKAASHGCIRLTVENSKFIYDVVPVGTSVIIN